MEEKEITAILRVEGGTADQGILDIHDAANMIYGLARAINTVTHSFGNNEEVKSKAKQSTGAKTFIHSSRKGCFEEQVDIHFAPKIVKKIGPSVISNNFWDYLTCCWSFASGVPSQPVTPHVLKVLEKNPVFFYEIADALETPLALLHRPIVREKTATIFLARPRVGDVIRFDRNTLDFVTTREEQTETGYIEGNVTRFNVLSNFGRLFSDEERKVVSYNLANPDDRRVRDLAVSASRLFKLLATSE